MKNLLKIILISVFISIYGYGQSRIALVLGGLQSSFQYENTLPDWKGFKKPYHLMLGLRGTKYLFTNISVNLQLNYKTIEYKIIYDAQVLSGIAKIKANVLEIQIKPTYYVCRKKVGILLGLNSNYIIKAHSLITVRELNESNEENIKKDLRSWYYSLGVGIEYRLISVYKKDVHVFFNYSKGLSNLGKKDRWDSQWKVNEYHAGLNIYIF